MGWGVDVDGPRAHRRRFGPVPASSLAPHDHVAWVGHGTEDLAHVAASAFSAAAGRAELLVLVAEDPDPAPLAALGDLDSLVARGALRILTAATAYGDVYDPLSQLERFDEMLDEARDEGFSGMCIVADNTRFAAGTDELFSAWLGWEAAADFLQAHRPMTGICWFDGLRVAPERMRDLAALHPVVGPGLVEPPFQVFVDGDVLRLVGDVDASHVDRLRRVLVGPIRFASEGLDLSDLTFIDHHGMLALNDAVADAVADGERVRVLRARPVVREIWALISPSPARLVFT